MITGTKAAILAVQDRLNAQCGKPDTVAPQPCKSCGATGIVEHPDPDEERVLGRCTSCSAISGPRGATFRIYAASERGETGVWESECTSDIEDAIVAAKAKPVLSQTDEEKVLAAVDVKGAEK
jgi:hypothetical protein